MRLCEKAFRVCICLWRSCWIRDCVWRPLGCFFFFFLFFLETYTNVFWFLLGSCWSRDEVERFPWPGTVT